MYLTEVVPPGPKAGDDAERVRTRLLHQIDQKHNPRTRASVGQLLDKWLQVLDVDPSTRRSYEGYIRKHIRPLRRRPAEEAARLVERAWSKDPTGVRSCGSP